MKNRSNKILLSWLLSLVMLLNPLLGVGASAAAVEVIEPAAVEEFQTDGSPEPTSTPEATATPEATTEATPEATTEATPEATPEASPEASPEAVPVRVTFALDPAGAALTVYDAEGETIAPVESPVYSLLPGEYTYSASAPGYDAIERVPLTVTEGEELSVTVSLTIYPAFAPDPQTVEGVTVRVSASAGVFPAGALLSVKSVPVDAQQAVDAAVETERGGDVNVAVSYTFDIKVLDENGSELQPVDGTKVRVSFSLAAAADANLESSVYHIEEDESGSLNAESLYTAAAGNTVAVTTEGFSYYTVEFTYNAMQYVLPGNSSVALTAILDAVGLSGTVSAVSVSNEELFSASVVDGNWVVRAHRAFDTEEWMRVTINGVSYEITVTDAAGVAEVNGTQYNSFADALSAWTNGSTLKLLADVETGSTITVSGTKTLDLNGYGITKTGGDNVIWITGGNLTVNDSNTTTTHYFNVDGNGLAVNINTTSGAQSFNGGYITGGTGHSFDSLFGGDGGGVYLDGGSFTLNGGTILGNTTGNDNGGGVEIYSGTMTMNGGTISYNKIGIGLRAGSSNNNRGGGATTANFVMNGGVIANNKTRGILHDWWCYGDDYATFYGGSVINNGDWGISAKYLTIAGSVTVSGNANGVTFASSTATISGSPVISGNTGANLKVNDGKTINVSGSLSGANIGITMQTPGVFTGSTDTSLNDASVFTSDDASYAVGKNADGQLYLGTPPVADVDGTEYTDFSAALNVWTDGTTLTLLDDVTTASTITVSDTKSLDLNGYGIRATSTYYSIFNLTNASHLTVTDSAPDRSHYITVESYRGTEVSDTGTPSEVTDGTGVVMISGGYITGGLKNDVNYSYGGAFCVNSNASLTMTGGSIIGNHACNGGAVYLNGSGSTASFTNTLFAYNSSRDWGGAIWNENSDSLRLINCTIRGNKTNKSNGGGGGAISFDSANLYIDGGLFEQNATSGHGGAIRANCNLCISGNPVIVDNFSGTKRENIYLLSNKMITVNAALGSDVRIGVTMATPGVFTGSTDTSLNDASVFTSDDASYAVGKNADGQLYLGTPITVTYASDHGTAPEARTIAAGLHTLPDAPEASGWEFGGWNDGTSTYDAETEVTVSGDTTFTAQWTVIPATAPTISGVTGATLTYGYESGSVSVTATAADGHTITGYQWYENTADSSEGGTAIDGATEASYDIPTGLSVGTYYYYCVVTATRTDNSQTASATSEAAVVNVNRAAAAVTADAASKTYGEGDPVYTATVTGLVNGDAANVLTYTFSRDPGEDVGDYTVTPGGAATQGNYTVTYATGTLTVNRAAATVTAEDKSKIHGEDDPAFTAAVTGLQRGDEESVLTYTISRDAGEDAGDYAVTPSGEAEQGNYDVSYATGTLTINKATATVTADALSKTYGEDDPAFTAAVTGLQRGDEESVLTYTISRDAGEDVGEYAITPSGDAQQGNYDVTYAAGTLSITKATDYTIPTGLTAAYGQTLADVALPAGWTWDKPDAGVGELGEYSFPASYTPADPVNYETAAAELKVTVEKAKPGIAVLPKGVEGLDYTGSTLTLITGGQSAHGAFYYRLGEDGVWTTNLPKATEGGFYTVWYYLKGDKNHTDLGSEKWPLGRIDVIVTAPDVFVVTGTIYRPNGVTPLYGATVTLMSGTETLASVTTGTDGFYRIAAEAGMYNLAVEWTYLGEPLTKTVLLTVEEGAKCDVTIPDGKVSSSLEVVSGGSAAPESSGVAVDGLSEEAEAIQRATGSRDVAVNMTVEQLVVEEGAASAGTIGVQLAPQQDLLVFEINLEQTVESVTTALTETDTVLKIVIPCKQIGREDFAVYRSHDGVTSTLIESDSEADGTVQFDRENGYIIIFTKLFSTYAVSYTQFYNVSGPIQYGSYTGPVAVTLTDSEGETVGEDEISLSGGIGVYHFQRVTRGSYTLTAQWTENEQEIELTESIEIK